MSGRRRSGRCWPVSDWPTFDQRAWQKLLEPEDLLEGTAAPGARWASATRHKYRRGYGRWLDFLSAQGLLDTMVPPQDRVTPAVVRRYHAHLAAIVAPFTVFTRLSELWSVVRALAPERDWVWLRSLIRRCHDAARLAARPKPTRASNELFERALGVLQGIDGHAGTKGVGRRLAKAVAFRDALTIALLAARPIRLRNLAMIRLDRHLVRTAGGYELVFAEDETKTRQPIELPLPWRLMASLDRYLRDFRPVLLGVGSGDRLWIDRYGRPMREEALYWRIVRVTRRWFGSPINPHRFRDCLATTVAIADPVHIGIVSALLGHRSQRTAERHYNQARQIEAGRHYQATLARLRRTLTRKARSRADLSCAR